MPSRPEKRDDTDYSQEAWEWLSDRLASRRADLRYTRFKHFTDAVERDERQSGFYKLAWNIENNWKLKPDRTRRFTPSAGNLARIEDGYRLERGSILRVLRAGPGTELGLLPTTTIPADLIPADIAPYAGDDLVRRILDAPRLTIESKFAIARKVIAERTGNGGQQQQRRA